MILWLSLLLIGILALIPFGFAGIAGLDFVFGIVIPYAAIVIFLLGIVYRVLNWARSPVPFRIPTTCGQQRSLPWIKNSPLESPHTGLGVIGRMALEILLFRSLFRNTRAELRDGPKLTYGSSKWLWLGALAFHWSFLVVLIRHFRFFAEPVPGFVSLVEGLDGFFQVCLPIILITDAVILGALTFLFLRRIVDPKLRYISLISDYFPLLLIAGIAITGILMRYFFKVDIIAVKELGTGILSLHPILPLGISPLFYAHLFFVSCLIAYFPFSKLTHLGGVFLSPTRNLANNNRTRRHLNPWNPPVPVHTYAEYEDEFREVMKAAGLPVDKE